MSWSPAEDYIRAWATPHALTREELVGRVYTENALFFSSEDGDLRLQGHRSIVDNITHVNERDIQGNGLAIELVGVATNHRLVKVTWRMVTPTGDVALTGMNILLVDAASRIEEDYILIG